MHTSVFIHHRHKHTHTSLTCAIVTLAAFCFCGLECDEMRSACDGTSNLQHYNLHQQQPKQIENYVSGMLEMAHFHCVLCVLLCAVRARAMRLISHTAICLVWTAANANPVFGLGCCLFIFLKSRYTIFLYWSWWLQPPFDTIPL